MNNATRILSASHSQRRAVLLTLLGSDKQFRFDGKLVCVMFLKKCFHFSTVLLAEVSRGSVTRPLSSSSSNNSQPHSGDDTSQGLSLQSTTSSSAIKSDLNKKEAVLSFIQRIADDCGDLMPDRSEKHLPFYQYGELFPVFANEFKNLPSFPACITKILSTCLEIKLSQRESHESYKVHVLRQM